MKICCWSKDGGPESHVWCFYLIEWKAAFSIALLRFDDGSREAYHSHAFNAISWLFSGALHEHAIESQDNTPYRQHWVRLYEPSWKPIWTPRERFHRVYSVGRSWALSFRGPWVDKWREQSRGREYFLTHGRVVVQ